jgi:AmmeMemoRadiSam system protein A
MTEQARKKLLKIAREAVEAAVRGAPSPEVREEEPELQPECGCFVTLKTRGRLRGCLGNFSGKGPLYKLVAKMARASATEDPRFFGSRLTPSEMRDLEIEISVLSPLEPIDDPLKIELGVHGIHVRRGVRAGCFLPQVATETGWSKEEFLGHCCEGKAGLAWDAWRDPETEVLVFTAEVFGE